MTLAVQQTGGILWLTLDAPPVNAIDAATRAGLMEAIVRAGEDEAIAGVLITGAHGRFSAGADITEFGDLKPPSLPEVIDRLEALEKPVVALVDGIALGGGFELALGAHVRLATERARFGLPEIKLGLLPGAGGTQRLPRLIGADAAIELMVSGREIDGTEALELGIVDAICASPFEDCAVRVLDDLVAAGESPVRLSETRTGLDDPAAFLEQVAAWREAIRGRAPEALGRIVDCVEAALLLPFEQGREFEATAFADCMETESSRALRHLFRAERAAARFARAAPAAEVKRVGIIGAGRTGAALAAASLEAGLSVAIWEQDSYAAERAGRVVAKALAHRVERGHMTSAALAGCRARLDAGIGPVALGRPDIVLECVDEDFPLKARVLDEAAEAVGPGVPIGSATSWIGIDRLAATIPHPERFFGFHPAAPPARTRTVELVSGRVTHPAALATAARFARAIGRIVVRSGAGPGYIVNRLTRALRRACDAMIEAGATPDQVDHAFRAWGFALGPYQALDREGLDYAWLNRREGTAGSALAERLIRAGRIGRRNGQGFYDYREDGRAVVSPAVTTLIEATRAEARTPQRAFTDTEIVARGLDALAVEGARALEDGTAAAAGDIDVALVHAIGFPRLRGGPMCAADLGGLAGLVTRLDARASEAPALWTPPALLLSRAGAGENLTDA